ncbi:MAG: FtsH protease activity modulator HflK [Alphaproteobacteria bacterium]
MPWSNNSSGGNGSGPGGPGGPWGSGPQQSGAQPPDLEELLKKGQDRLRSALPSGGRGNAFVALIAVAAVFALWLYQSFYTVEQNELGQELVFGKPKDEVSQAGLHFHYWPVETVEKVLIIENREQIGANSSGASETGLMLSGDQNIVDVTFAILWRVADPKLYLFNVRDPQQLVRATGEAVMREVVGRRPSADVFRQDRLGIAADVRDLVQRTLDSYGVGISITGIALEDAAPPREVADAFEEVQRAQQDQERFQREAEGYANRILGQARGESSQIREQAEAYKQKVIAEADGEAQRFVSVFNEYDKAKDVTRTRIYLETLERVLRDSNKIILESGASGSGVVPYLPLNELTRGQTSQGGN